MATSNDTNPVEIPIQRTIEPLDEVQANQSAAAPANAAATTTVFYGLASVLLVIIAIGAAVLFWKDQAAKPDRKVSAKPVTRHHKKS